MIRAGFGSGVLAAVLAASVSFGYFRYERQAEPLTTSGQHYVVVDEPLWQHARPDLGDVRIYWEQTEIPYKLIVESGGSETERKSFRVLQPGMVGGKTQFLLDMAGVPEYDRIELKLATKDFVAHARVEGQDDPHGARWADLGTTTLYDLSTEKLGRNSTLQIPVANYKYLRVTVDRAVKPGDVEGGTAGVTRARQAVWHDLISKAAISQEGGERQGNATVLTFSIPRNIPIERVVFNIDAAQENFRRPVEIQSDKGSVFGSGEITRIHMLRNGQKIDVEQASLDLEGMGPATLKIRIQNGDDAPLNITDARLQQYERRIYFDSPSGVEAHFYYGDEKLGAPVFDYAKLFAKGANADQVLLRPEQVNAGYTGRPDDRPWSERHPAVLWMAIIVAVAILGTIALRSMKAAA
ncbi:MAG TPA: DUF3999 family protein [Phototrophicaceae bacterium]|nr:DUF3999 family protein [Phototrophicaceae bacterium]